MNLDINFAMPVLKTLVQTGRHTYTWVMYYWLYQKSFIIHTIFNSFCSACIWNVDIWKKLVQRYLLNTNVTDGQPDLIAKIKNDMKEYVGCEERKKNKSRLTKDTDSISFSANLSLFSVSLLLLLFKKFDWLKLHIWCRRAKWMALNYRYYVRLSVIRNIKEY